MIKVIEKYLTSTFGTTEGTRLFSLVNNRFQSLQNRSYNSKNQKKYLISSILPTVAMYQILQSELKKDDAFYHVDKMIFENTSQNTRAFWLKLGKLPFFYPMFRKMFSTGLKGDSWDTHWIQNNKKHLHYNITRCLWHDEFTFYDCSELCSLFCRNDTINYTNVSKHMKYTRTKTLGNGDDCCDFRFDATRYL